MLSNLATPPDVSALGKNARRRREEHANSQCPCRRIRDRLRAIGATAATPPFVGKIEPLSAAQRALMTGVSWRPGCPVRLGDLRQCEVGHWGFDGRARTGRARRAP